MGKKYRIAIYDILGRRLCPLFDSDIEQEGSAYSIRITREINGWKELSFTLSKKMANGEDNYR